MTFQQLLQLDARYSEKLRLRPEQRVWWTLEAILAHSGDSWFWASAMAIIWLADWNGPWHYRAAIMGIGIVGLAFLVLAIKFMVRRRRPEGEWGKIYRNTDPHSFPSGHAARAALLATLAWGVGPLWLAILLTIWAPLVSVARVRMGVHYLSDIVVGALLGILAGVAWLKFVPIFSGWFPFLF